MTELVSMHCSTMSTQNQLVASDLFNSMLKYRKDQTKNCSLGFSVIERRDATILYRMPNLSDKVDTVHQYEKGSGKLDWIK